MKFIVTCLLVFLIKSINGQVEPGVVTYERDETVKISRPYYNYTSIHSKEIGDGLFLAQYNELLKLGLIPDFLLKEEKDKNISIDPYILFKYVAIHGSKNDDDVFNPKKLKILVDYKIISEKLKIDILSIIQSNKFRNWQDALNSIRYLFLKDYVESNEKFRSNFIKNLISVGYDFRDNEISKLFIKGKVSISDLISNIDKLQRIEFKSTYKIDEFAKDIEKRIKIYYPDLKELKVIPLKNERISVFPGLYLFLQDYQLKYKGNSKISIDTFSVDLNNNELVTITKDFFEYEFIKICNQIALDLGIKDCFVYKKDYNIFNAYSSFERSRFIKDVFIMRLENKNEFLNVDKISFISEHNKAFYDEIVMINILRSCSKY